MINQKLKESILEQGGQVKFRSNYEVGIIPHSEVGIEQVVVEQEFYDEYDHEILSFAALAKIGSLFIDGTVSDATAWRIVSVPISLDGRTFPELLLSVWPLNEIKNGSVAVQLPSRGNMMPVAVYSPLKK